MPTFNMDEVELVQPDMPEGDGHPGGDGGGPMGDGHPPPEGGKGKSKGEHKDKSKDQDKKPGQPGQIPDALGADEIDVDKVHKEIEERLKKRNELKDAETAKAHEQHPDFTPTKGGASGAPGKGGGIGQITGKADPYAQPKHNWKQLVKIMIPSGVPEPVSSYAKPSRKAATSMHIAGQTGSAALPPGQRTDTSEARKLAFVFDTSGSMHHTIQKAMAEIPGLIKSANFDAAPIGVVYFAGDMRLFVVNMRENTYQEVTSLADMASVDVKKHPKKKNWRHVLTLAAGGGTEFKPQVLTEIVQLIHQGYNVVFFSDSDMLADQNWANFVYLTVKHRDHLAFVADSKMTWRAVCEKLKMNLPRFSYLD